MKMPTLVWFEQLATPTAIEIPRLLDQNFNVLSATSEAQLKPILGDEQLAAVFFNFDYPDRHRLAVFAELKRLHPSVPMVVMSVLHSEPLATWVFRAGAMDFLVKPLNQGELEACVKGLLQICEMKTAHRRRTARSFDSAIPAEIPRTVSTVKDKLAPAVFYVQQHYNEHIYSDAMARLCDMSPSRFSHGFSKTYGVTFQEFLLRFRVRRACQQLVSPARPPISEVAYSVGFSDPSYFTRVFKRYVGVVPSEFSGSNMRSSDELGDVDDDTESPLSSKQIVGQLNDLSNY